MPGIKGKGRIWHDIIHLCQSWSIQKQEISQPTRADTRYRWSNRVIRMFLVPEVGKFFTGHANVGAVIVTIQLFHWRVINIRIHL
ncbi:MAG TPA: hypothetical protein VFM05_14380 [Candidatus Saccharimonadales bacterium]|nr:hypothetical protein [Candidatus Saccharimonadales bacterium]